MSATDEHAAAIPDPAKNDTPRLASDVFRGYVILAATVVPVVLVPFIMASIMPDAAAYASIVTVFAAWAFLALASSIVTVITFSRVEGATLERWLRSTTPRTRRARVIWRLNGGGAISWAVTGSVIAVSSVIILTISSELRRVPIVVVAGIAVVVASLFMIITAYAVRYARENADTGGLEFPRTEHPRFSDYLYLAVQVSTTFSSSDVQITSASLRKAVSLNSLISFAFNTVIVALLVSVLISTAA